MAEKPTVSFEELRTQQVILALKVNKQSEQIKQLQFGFAALAKLVDALRECIPEQTELFPRQVKP